MHSTGSVTHHAIFSNKLLTDIETNKSVISLTPTLIKNLYKKLNTSVGQSLDKN